MVPPNIWYNYITHTYIYICIYIYIRQGEEVPREDVNQDHWIGEKTVFHCGKMEIFHVVLFIVDVFQLRINFFCPSKLKSIMDHHNMLFLVFLFSPLELRAAHFVLYQRSLEKGIIYCVSTGILMWCCLSLVIHSDFAYHQNFRVLWVSCFFCFYTKALVQDISTTIEGTNQAAGNFSLPTPWSVRVRSRHFPNQAFCLHSALLERCDVYTPPLHASYMNVFTPHLFTQVTWTLLHPTPPQPTPSPRMTHAWQVQENLH